MKPKFKKRKPVNSGERTPFIDSMIRLYNSVPFGKEEMISEQPEVWKTHILCKKARD